MSNKTISCCQCGTSFTFTVGEQEWFLSKGFSEPKYCKDCRAERKKQKEEQNQKMRQENNQKAA